MATAALTAAANAPGYVSGHDPRGGGKAPGEHGTFAGAMASPDTQKWPGMQTNEVSTVPVLGRPFREGFERGYGGGEVLFNLKLSTITTATEQTGGCAIVSLPTLNFYLDCLRVHANDANDVRRPPGGDNRVADWMSVEAFNVAPVRCLNNIRYVGVLRNIMATSGKAEVCSYLM